MNAPSIRAETPNDHGAVDALLVRAFSGEDEARLVAALRRAGDVVLSLVAERDEKIVGHVLFSRLFVNNGNERFSAVALAPLAVLPEAQDTGIGTALVEEAHRQLVAAGEKLSVVLGEPAYYGRFGYDRALAEKFDSAYQCESLQALAWDDGAPRTGKLIYAAAFSDLG